MKKLLAVILALVMALGLCTATWADEENSVAEFNDQAYATLKAAVEAAAHAAAQETYPTTKTVKLLGSVTEDLTGIEGWGTFMLIVDLNGFDYTGEIVKDHDLTIKNSNTTKTGTAHFNYVQCNVLELQGGNIIIDDASIDHTTKITGANVTINGGEFRTRGNYTKAIDVAEGTGAPTVNGGIFNTTDSLESEENRVIECTVKRQLAVGESVKDVKCWTIGKTTEGTRTIKKTAAGGEALYFYDLSTAALAAKDGDTIELLADQTINRKVEIKNSVTVKGNGHKIALAETVKNLQVGSAYYGEGVFETSGDNKETVIENVVFKDIDRQTVMIRAYVSGSNSTITVNNCTFDNVKALNVVRAASGTAVKCKLIVTNSVFTNCAVSMNGIIQIDSNDGNNATSEIKNNDFINNTTSLAGNAATIYLSAPAEVKANYFERNSTTNTSEITGTQKNGIIVTGTNAGGSKVEDNAFVSHTFTRGDAQGAVYGAKGDTSVSNNYYGTGINHLAKAGEGFSEKSVASGYSGVGVNRSHSKSTSSGGYYYAGPSISAVLNGPNKSATDYTSGDYGLIFRSTASYSGFQGVQVDGKALAKSNYTVEDNGGTEVYLKAAYLKTLAAGKHTVTILSTAGNVSMDFTIGGKTSSPTTFDAGVGIYAVTAVLSLGGMAWTAKKRQD